ncbi:MAG: fumarate reductase (quinol) flavoprotein subunit [Gammaproteobacteria bacterium]|jgi:fumarate reductase flavoprotein subunit
METVHSDVLIVGAGGAGLRAAIAAAEADPSLDIALVSKVYPMRSHTVAAEGGAAGVAREDDSQENHIQDTIAGGDWLSDQDAVEYFVDQAPRELARLERWGCPWSRTADGRVAVRPFGGMKKERTWYAADKSGFHILHTLFQTSLKYPTIQRFDEFFALDLLVEDGRCLGMTALELRSGREFVFLAPSVIIASGGAGRVFPFTTNGGIKTGDGMAMAYRAGVPLKDMEFIQYHPTGLPGTGILITEGARGEGGLLVNKDGYRYLQDYGLGPPDPWPRKKAMELGPRDRLSQAFWQEQRKGRCIETDDGPIVHLDVRHLGEAKINERLPFVRELARTYAGVDPVHAPIPVRPVVHYVMGGIDTDITASCPVDGLFAAGECACVSLNGANRLGSNSLSELLVFGSRAGEGAARLASEAGRIQGDGWIAPAEASFARVEKLLGHPESGESIAGLRDEMHAYMEDCVGIYRDESMLARACDGIAELRERYHELSITDKSRVFNTELMYALELGAMLEVAEAMAHSALHRRESRGAHQRLDYTARDDEHFLSHSLATCNGDAPPRIDYRPVTITRWPPGERVYGRLDP